MFISQIWKKNTDDHYLKPEYGSRVPPVANVFTMLSRIPVKWSGDMAVNVTIADLAKYTEKCGIDFLTLDGFEVLWPTVVRVSPDANILLFDS